MNDRDIQKEAEVVYWDMSVFVCEKPASNMKAMFLLMHLYSIQMGF